MSGLPVRRRAFRWLDFDIENRPLSYWYDGNPTAEVTAIAACWVGQPETMKVWLLRQGETDAEHRDLMREMLDGFAAMYAVADGVTGHYIRKHDLPILRGSMIENGLKPIGSKLSHDTKLDLAGWKDIPKTQEYLLEMLDLEEQKHHMSQGRWRQANRLTREGLLQTEERVSTDVMGHMALRSELLKLGLLRAPKVWSA